MSWDDLDYSDGEIYNVHYGLIHKGLPIICSPNRSQLPFIKKRIKIQMQTLCKSGDIIIADASEDTNDVGRAIELIECDNLKVLAGLHTIHARSAANKIAIGFKGYLFAASTLKEQIRHIAQGTKVYSISSKFLSPLNISLPSLPEQSKIASFLAKIDERIETQRQVIKERKAQRIALLQQLFSQSLRFPNFSEEWEKTTLGEIVVCLSSNLTEASLYAFGVTPIFGANGLCGFGDIDKPLSESILIVKDGSGVGRVQYKEDSHYFLATLNSLKVKSEANDQKYVYYFLERFDFKKYISGSGIPHIYFSDYSKASIPLPSFAEQGKIAGFLTKVDERIELEEELLKQYERQKRYLLKQMFI